MVVFGDIELKVSFLGLLHSDALPSQRMTEFS